MKNSNKIFLFISKKLEEKKVIFNVNITRKHYAFLNYHFGNKVVEALEPKKGKKERKSFRIYLISVDVGGGCNLFQKVREDVNKNIFLAYLFLLGVSVWFG